MVGNFVLAVLARLRLKIHCSQVLALCKVVMGHLCFYSVLFCDGSRWFGIPAPFCLQLYKSTALPHINEMTGLLEKNGVIIKVLLMTLKCVLK